MLRVCLRFGDQTGCYCVLEPRPAVCQVMQKWTSLKSVKCGGDIQKAATAIEASITQAH